MKKLNLGSGYKRYPDFINIDQDHHCNPDIVTDLESPNCLSMIPDDSVEIILAHHILEHIGSNYIPLLKELYRVAKHKAIIDIRVPHPNHEIFLNDPTHKRPITVEGLRLFSKQYNLQEIQRGGSSSTLGIMNDIDFEIVHFDYIHDPYYDNIKTTATPEQLERIFRSEINTTLEIHVVLTVIKNV